MMTTNTMVLNMARHMIIEGFDVARIQPLPHHLLMSWPGKRSTQGGILIPEDRERLGRMNGIILAVGPECDHRLEVGQSVQFSFNSEKQFIGPQSPGDRDPVFFMREEDVIGILLKHGEGEFDVSIQMINGCILTIPEIKPAERSGLVTVNREDPETFSVWGKVVQVDSEYDNDCAPGDTVLYVQNQKEELRVGDFSAPIMHVIRQRMKCEILAVKE